MYRNSFHISMRLANNICHVPVEVLKDPCSTCWWKSTALFTIHVLTCLSVSAPLRAISFHAWHSLSSFPLLSCSNDAAGKCRAKISWVEMRSIELPICRCWFKEQEGESRFSQLVEKIDGDNLTVTAVTSAVRVYLASTVYKRIQCRMREREREIRYLWGKTP